MWLEGNGMRGDQLSVVSDQLSACGREIIGNGKIVLPCRPRFPPKGKLFFRARCVDVRAGDTLEAKIEDGRIVLTPRKKSSHRARIVTDRVTGLPVLAAGPEAPQLSSKEVEELLASFP
jgi:hypothetical protein